VENEYFNLKVQLCKKTEGKEIDMYLHYGRVCKPMKSRENVGMNDYSKLIMNSNIDKYEPILDVLEMKADHITTRHEITEKVKVWTKIAGD
jgi:hypothetical protein